jgi:hypothetical protein
LLAKLCNNSMAGKKGCGKYDQATRNLYHKYRGRGLRFEYELFMELTSSKCHYCHAPPSNVKRYKGHTPYIYNGLDRLDPKQGYLITNVVPCCWCCNKMKSNMTYSEFISHIGNILLNLPNEKT